MPKPPMNDTLTILSPIFNNGKPEIDSYGRPKLQEVSTKARVEYIPIQEISDDGAKSNPTLIIDVPPEAFVKTGFEVVWVSRQGDTIRKPIEGIQEVLNYGGTNVYFRKLYIGKKPPNG
jgi:hypothetical protein